MVATPSLTVFCHMLMIEGFMSFLLRLRNLAAIVSPLVYQDFVKHATGGEVAIYVWVIGRPPEIGCFEVGRICAICLAQTHHISEHTSPKI